MTDYLVTAPEGQYNYITKSGPVFNGSMYIGEPNTDPEVEGNQIDVYILNADETKSLITQPISISSGGYPVDSNGDYVRLVVDQNYSQKILDRLGVQAVYIENKQILEEQDAGEFEYDTVADMIAATGVVAGSILKTKGYHVAGDGGQAEYIAKLGTDADGYGSHNLADGVTKAVLQESGVLYALQWGFKGDDTYDEAPGINAMFAYAHTNGGRTVDIPRGATGVALLLSSLVMGNNTKLIVDSQLTMKKTHSSYFLSNGYSYDDTSVIAAYGGNSNIHIEGGIWDGQFDTSLTGFVHFAIGYCDGLKIKNVQLLNNYDSHMIDLASSKNFIIESCVFKGQNKDAASNAFEVDMLQLDINRNLSFPTFGVPIEGPTKNGIIRDCWFGPNEDVTEFNNAYVGIGSHYGTHGEYIDSILVDTCEFHDTTSSGVYNWKWSNSDVRNCKFFNCQSGVRLQAINPGAASNENRAGVPQTTPEATFNCKVLDCYFENLTSYAVRTTEVTDAATFDVYHKRIHVTGAELRTSTGTDAAVLLRDCQDSTATGISAYDCPDMAAIKTQDCIRFSVSLDVAENVNRGLRLLESHNGKAYSGSISVTSGESSVNIDACSNLDVTLGMIKESGRSHVLVSNACRNIGITGGTLINHAVDSDASAFKIQDTADNVRVSGVSVIYEGAEYAFANGGFHVTPTCTEVYLNWNTATGITEPFQHYGTTGALFGRAYRTPPTAPLINGPLGSMVLSATVTSGRAYVRETGTSTTWAML